MSLLRKYWWRATRKTVRLAEVDDLQPGETAIFGGFINRDLLKDAFIVARWECTRCDRELNKKVPALDAEQYGVSIACPYCDPDNVYSRGVEAT